MLHARVVDQNVHGAQLGGDAPGQRGNGQAVAQIQWVIAGGHTQCVQLGQLCIGAGRRLGAAMQGNGGAFASQLPAMAQPMPLVEPVIQATRPLWGLESCWTWGRTVVI